jgi:hypothetical protein
MDTAEQTDKRHQRSFSGFGRSVHEAGPPAHAPKKAVGDDHVTSFTTFSVQSPGQAFPAHKCVSLEGNS